MRLMFMKPVSGGLSHNGSHQLLSYPTSTKGAMLNTQSVARCVSLRKTRDVRNIGFIDLPVALRQPPWGHRQMRSCCLFGRVRAEHTTPDMSSSARFQPDCWFGRLFGFDEGNYEQTRSRFEVNGTAIAVKSDSIDASWSIGEFTVPSLKSLRDRSDHLRLATRKLSMSIVIGDVTELLCQPENRRATFQVASQFNCLEFPDPDITPEDGISDYDTDRTQGPACSIACGPATVYRNYFVPVRDATGAVVQGQRADAQLNNADELLAACGQAAAEVSVRNGYMAATVASLEALNAFLSTADRETLLLKLKIGVHSDVQVRPSSPHLFMFTATWHSHVCSCTSRVPAPSRLVLSCVR